MTNRCQRKSIVQKAIFYTEYQWIILLYEISVPEQFRELPNLDLQIPNDIFRQVVQRSQYALRIIRFTWNSRYIRKSSIMQQMYTTANLGVI
jgi:hypothetical protein